MKTAAIIQARMTSTRLPGKVLKKIMDKPLLEYQIERLLNSKLINEIIVATTTNVTDKPIVDLCNKLNIKFFRGSEEDVLSRYYNAAKEFNAEVIVRLTSDCPVIDSEVVDKVIKYYLNNKNEYDYVSNTLIRTFPRGMDTEVFPFSVLETSFRQAKTKSEREHVTPYIYNDPDIFNLGYVTYKQNESYHRWTVDTGEDLELIRNIITELYPVNKFFTLEDIIDLFNRYPNWLKINAHIEQKKLGV